MRTPSPKKHQPSIAIGLNIEMISRYIDRNFLRFFLSNCFFVACSSVTGSNNTTTKRNITGEKYISIIVIGAILNKIFLLEYATKQHKNKKNNRHALTELVALKPVEVVGWKLIPFQGRQRLSQGWQRPSGDPFWKAPRLGRTLRGEAGE